MPRLIAHLLLAMCLILNGIGSVALAAVAPLTHGDVPMQSDALMADGGSSCHETAANASSQTAPASSVPAPVETGCCEDPAQSCDMAACTSVCSQYPMAVWPVPQGVGGEDLGAHYQAANLPSRDDPSLRQPVRPPIA